MLRRAGVLVVVLLPLAGCSGDSGEAGGGRGGAIEEWLAMLPAGMDDGPLVIYGDLARAAELAGGVASAEDLGAISDRAGEPGRVAVALPVAIRRGLSLRLEGFAEETGWDPLAVDSFAELSFDRKDVSVMQGEFSEDDLREALGEPDDGVWEIGVHDEAAGSLGPGYLSLVDGRLVFAPSEAEMEAVRARSDRGTLADDEVLRDLATALDGQDVYSAYLAGTPLFRELAAATCEGLLPAEPLGVASGIADDGGGPVIVLAAVHDSTEAAATNADALEVLVQETDAGNSKPWREQVEVDAITADGKVTIVRLRLTDETPAVLWQDVFNDITSLLRAC